MIIKILLIDMFITAIFMYLVILGANKNKTEEEIEMDRKEEEIYLKEQDSRRQKSDKQNKKK